MEPVNNGRSSAGLLANVLLHAICGVEQFQKEIIDLHCAAIGPAELPPDRFHFRHKFLQEEIDELLVARGAENTSGQVDALLDLAYVALGAVLEMGVSPTEAFNLVQDANMAKQRGQTSRGHQFDAVKPAGWTPPDHDAMLIVMALRAACSPAFIRATQIKLERGARYNQGSVQRADHFPFGNVGHAQLMWIKAIRLRSEIEGGMSGGLNDNLSEHLVDMINYLSFWWEELNGGIRP